MEQFPTAHTPKIGKEEHDPSKSSLVEKNIRLVEGGLVDAPSVYNGASKKLTAYIDEQSGEEFFSIDESKRPEFQRFVSYIVKGIINTADIVKIDGVYFSHKQKLHNVEKGNDTFMEEIKADAFILKNIFGDYDHTYYRSDDSKFQSFVKQRDTTEDAMSDMDIEHRNLVINETNKNSYFFDLERSGYIGSGKGEGFHSLQMLTDEDKSKYKKYLVGSIYSPEEPSKRFNIKTIRILKDKIDSLIGDVFSPDKFDLFQKIVSKSGTLFDETTFEFYKFHSDKKDEKAKEIFSDLCMRCKIMKGLVEEILQAQDN